MSSCRLAPFSLEPRFDSRPWGSRTLAPLFDHTLSCEAEPIGEAWLTGEECDVRNGPLRGKRLRELCENFGRELVGRASRYSDRFPLLLKFLFTQDRLSVQVHPGDEAAHAVGEPCGKTECWYIVRAEADTTIALGLKPGVDKAQLRKAIAEVRAEELLNWVEVCAGDMVYVAAGTVHTIGPGAVIFEVQQNSDLTYRLYDYGRPRQLHLAEGMAALKEVTQAGKVIAQRLDAAAERLTDTEHFVVEKYLMSGQRSFRTEVGQSPRCLVALGGGGTVSGAGFAPLHFESSEAVVIPACIGDFAVEPDAPMELLTCTLP